MKSQKALISRHDSYYIYLDDHATNFNLKWIFNAVSMARNGNLRIRRSKKKLKMAKTFSNQHHPSLYNLYPLVPRGTTLVLTKFHLSATPKTITIAYFSTVTPPCNLMQFIIATWVDCTRRVASQKVGWFGSVIFLSFYL